MAREKNKRRELGFIYRGLFQANVFCAHGAKALHKTHAGWEKEKQLKCKWEEKNSLQRVANARKTKVCLAMVSHFFRATIASGHVD